MEKPRLLYGICRSGRGDLGGEQTRRPERIRNGNDLEIWSAVKSLSGECGKADPFGTAWGRPMTSGKKQACAPDGPPGSWPKHPGTDVQR
jgi:hypothetical protein